jgi:hypothetical protein
MHRFDAEAGDCPFSKKKNFFEIPKNEVKLWSSIVVKHLSFVIRE